MEQTLQSYRDGLVEVLRTQGISDPAVLQAFAQVPRHCFVRTYYERQGGGNTWVRKTATECEDWYQRIYSDKAFVTLMDTVGRTLSSSSQPGIMAQMLSSLDVRPGQRVLEIGTGTGYNTALLAELTGDPALVTTIDIDPRTIEAAWEILRSVGYDAVTILTGDGREGYTPGAPYDRIIATASTPVIPQTWHEQLAPGGKLVAILQPGIAMGGGVLQAIKYGDLLLGKLVCEASFMPLHDGQFEQRPSRAPHINMHIPVIENFSFTRRLFDTEVIWDANFQFFLYATFPTLHIVEQQRGSSSLIYTLFFEEGEPEHYVSFFEGENTSMVELRGEKARSLWMRLVRVFTLWDALGTPTISQYCFEMGPQGQCCTLQNDDGKIWPFLL